MLIVLRRKYEDQYGTHGELYCGPTLLCYTLEPKWAENENDVSCIPPDTYQCSAHNSTDHPHTWEVNGVKGRVGILIHEGNWLSNTLGCILVGMVKLPNGVGHSLAALNMLRGFLPDNFTLQITATAA